MSAKTVIVLCALAQVGLSQYLGGWNGLGAGLGYGGLGGCGCGGGVASTGGGLPVASASPCPPVGISVLSENAYAGNLCAGGNLPFLGSVGIEGVLPTAGAGAVSYGCGNGAIGIGSEGPIGTGILAPTDFAPAAGLVGNGIGAYGIGYGGLGYGGLGYGCGRGCGCGAYI